MHYEAIRPIENPPCEIPWIIASFDIECLSSHGDFPQAVKDWKKPVRDLILYVDALPRTSVWTRSQFRTFLSSWCIDDIPNGPVTPKGYPIHGIFTKENKKPTKIQIERLLDGLYPIVFESRSATQ